MPKGGSREGAGRPRGSRGKRTAESVAKAEALGPTPLEVLLESMHAARAEGERAEAVECAKAAAPYVHPKLAPTTSCSCPQSNGPQRAVRHGTRPVGENLFEAAQPATDTRSAARAI